MESELDNVDWFITRGCDQAKFCGFCNAPWNKFPGDATKDEALKVAARVKQLKVGNLTLCGGEPTMYPYLPEVLDSLADSGVKVVLYSNTVSNPKFDWRKTLPQIDTLSLPIDAVSAAQMQFMRGIEQVMNAQRVLEEVKTSLKPPKVKVGTVVTRGNVQALPKIYEYLATAAVNVWRLYQFSPYGLGLRNIKRYLISNEEFDQAANSVVMINRQRANPMVISGRTREDIAGGYCRIMDSTGHFFRYDEIAYNPLGASIFDPVEEIIKGYDNVLNAKQKSWHNAPTSTQTVG